MSHPSLSSSPKVAQCPLAQKPTRPLPPGLATSTYSTLTRTTFSSPAVALSLALFLPLTVSNLTKLQGLPLPTHLEPSQLLHVEQILASPLRPRRAEDPRLCSATEERRPPAGRLGSLEHLLNTHQVDHTLGVGETMGGRTQPSRPRSSLLLCCSHRRGQGPAGGRDS